MNRDEAIATLTADLICGKVAPWSAEYAAAKLGVASPDNITVGALARRSFVEHKSGVKLNHLTLLDKPYLLEYDCPNDATHWMLASDDEDRVCSLCGSALVPRVKDGVPSALPLVQNYIGGTEDYYSYAGEVSVAGDVEAHFQNVLCYGPGVGHIGVGVGCFQLNKIGGPIEVKVAEHGRAVRNLAFVFDTEGERERAQALIKANLEQIIAEMKASFLDEFEGEVYEVDFLHKQHHGDRILHCSFYTRFGEYRGHGCTSKATGIAKNYIDKMLGEEGVVPRLSVIGMGRDGDLKPSPRNRRGRYVSALQRIPVEVYEKKIGRSIDDFLSYIELDRQGVLEETGWPAYSGMGGEIVPAFYRTFKCNPRPEIVSCYQKVWAEIRGTDLVFGVELPNVEVGMVSGPEGLVPPIGREALKVCGIRNAKEYAAALAAVTLGGEFNFATLHLREKLYTGR
jgi:hypothetical protein